MAGTAAGPGRGGPPGQGEGSLAARWPWLLPLAAGIFLGAAAFELAGRAVESVFDGPTFDAKHERYFCGIVDVEKAKDENLPTLLKFKDVPAIDALVTIDELHHRMCVSVVQKLEDRPLNVKLDFHGKVKPRSNRAKVHRLTGKSLNASNTAEHPNEVGLEMQEQNVGDTFTFPPASLTLLEFEI